MSKVTLQALRDTHKDTGYEKCLAFVSDLTNWNFVSEFDTFLPFQFGYITLGEHGKYKRRLAEEFGYLYSRTDDSCTTLVLIDVSARKRLDDKHWVRAHKDYTGVLEGEYYVDGWHDKVYNIAKQMIKMMGFKWGGQSSKTITVIRPASYE